MKNAQNAKIKIVTKESLISLLETKDKSLVLGRALIALFARQTKDEQKDELPDEKFLDISFLNKKEYHLAEKMKELLDQKQINALIPLIDDFGDERYSEGGDSERMSNEESY